MGLLTAPLTLVRAPVRVGLKAAEVGLSTAAEVARIATELLRPGREGSSEFPGYGVPAEPDYAADNGGPPDGDYADVAAAAPADAPPSIPDELVPDHVDQETVLVVESAEEGAEDGAGPELTVEAPWDGYDQMTAADIRDRLSSATAAEAAAVGLYESTHKNRRTVMDTAARALSG